MACPFALNSCDASQPEQVQAIVSKISAQFGGIDLLVNSAAVHPFGNVVDTDPGNLESLPLRKITEAFLPCSNTSLYLK